MAHSNVHVQAQVAAISQLTYRQWFAGRAAFATAFTPVSPDFGEQAMRADYIADKAWWLLANEPGSYLTLAEATAAAAAELPPPSGARRTARRGWLEELDVAVTASVLTVPSRQWGTTLVPSEQVFEDRR